MKNKSEFIEGTVKFFKPQNWGFIVSDSGKEIFVHVSGLIDEIRQNDRVRFRTANRKKGPVAIDVTLL